MKRRW